MFTLIEGDDVFAPEPLGRADVLIAGRQVLRVGAVDAAAVARLGVPVETVDAHGCYVVPGLADPHVNLSGAGSESGYASRTPEVQFDALATAGITTVSVARGVQAEPGADATPP